MSSRVIISPLELNAIAHYSPAIVNNCVAYCSGVLGTDPGTGELVPGGTYGQTRQALLNLEAVLHAAGSTLAQVLQMTCFLASPETFADFERAYGEIVPSPPPARATVGAHLVVAGALVEIQAMAIADAEQR